MLYCRGPQLLHTSFLVLVFLVSMLVSQDQLTLALQTVVIKSRVTIIEESTSGLEVL